MQNINNIRLAIKNNNRNELKECLKNEFIIECLINEDDFDSIHFIFKNLLTSELTMELFDSIINYCSSYHINNTAMKILKLIIEHSELKGLKLNILNTEKIYQICKYDGNIELIKSKPIR